MKNIFLILLLVSFFGKSESLLPPQSKLSFTTDEVTWTFLDLSPDGSINLWVMNADGTGAKKLSDDTTAMMYATPA